MGWTVRIMLCEGCERNEEVRVDEAEGVMKSCSYIGWYERGEKRRGKGGGRGG